MIFTTPQFVVFFLLLAAAYFASSGRARKVLLLAGSYLFYASWSAKLSLLLAGSTVLDFLVARALHRTLDPRRRRWLLACSVGSNLTILGVAKYYDFFVVSAAEGLAALGLSVQPATLDLVLPVGISFYTFQTMSYSIDVYRRQLAPTSSLLDFANFVAFFPQLVAGPIERAGRLLPQMAAVGQHRRSDSSGWALIAIGAFKKVVIADHMASIVEASYAHPADAYAPALWLGTYAFAVQIYCDFSGYSDLAVGVGRLLGVDLVQNFRDPYGATSPREFWRRWHISLSTWLRDYLYIALGGSRRSAARTQLNLAVTMLLGGLWHGAAWTFLAWGAYHGALLALGRGGAIARPLARMPRVVQRLGMFHLVCLGWVPFRAESWADAGTILGALLDPTGWELGGWLEVVSQAGQTRYLATIAAVLAVTVLVQWRDRGGSDRLAERLWRMPVAVRIWAVGLTLTTAVLLAPETRPPFVYFQF